MRFKGHGIKHFKKDMKGDLLVQFLIEVPNNLTEKQREELRTVDEKLTTANFPKQKEFLEKVKNI
jgi:DnaJ-class molecular chaperone